MIRDLVYHQVYVPRGPQVTVKNDGQTAHQDVSATLLVQGLEEGFKGTLRPFRR